MSVGDHDLLSLLPRTVLLPPMLLLVGALICWAVALRYPKVGQRLLGLCLVGLLVLALPITPAILFGALEKGISLTSAASGQPLPVGVLALPAVAPQAIVILGGDGSLGRASGAIFGGAQPGNLSLERLRAGAALQRRGGLPILLTGGVVNANSLPISILMRQSLEDDFKAQAQWIEPLSNDTWENAEFTAAILAREGITSVYVVTHAWHMRRALIAFRHFGIAVSPAPVSLEAYEGISLDMFQPSVKAWLDSYLALHEWVGCAFYALRG